LQRTADYRIFVRARQLAEWSASIVRVVIAERLSVARNLARYLKADGAREDGREVIEGRRG
jgi:hypothetical protein